MGLVSNAHPPKKHLSVQKFTSFCLMTVQIVGRIRVGPRPVHVYAINATSKAWSHSDAEGNFYVLSGTVNNGSWTFSKKVVPVSSHSFYKWYRSRKVQALLIAQLGKVCCRMPSWEGQNQLLKYLQQYHVRHCQTSFTKLLQEMAPSDPEYQTIQGSFH